MRNRVLLIAMVIVAVAIGLAISRKTDEKVLTVQKSVSNSNSHLDSHPVSQTPTRVPAYQAATEAKSLGATLEPSGFIGKTREAYKVAKQIPETLAQLPCYCHCDQGFGHKSLHSCFEDDHAAQCAVCTEEALLAHELQKKQRLSVEQIRKIIIEKYSS
ncbi:MAG TPA: CYCXC family (seleno)protein [Pyrinomonadaceae bacterium]